MTNKKEALIITQQLSWYQRWSSAFTALVKGYAQVEAAPQKVNHGASWDRPWGQKQGYDPLNALAVYAVHGYMNAGVSRCASDLAALNLRIIDGTGEDSKIVKDGPLVDLLNQPNSSMDGFLFREQLLVDIILSGNCYILLLGPSDLPISLVRLHPAEVRIITNADGSMHYEHNSDGNVAIYPADRVVHGRNASWEKGPAGLYGTGATEPLEKELVGDINAQKLASDSSAKGRPDAILSPREEADIWGSERRREILAAYNNLTRDGGALVLSGAIDVQQLSLSPRDMEYEKVRVFTRESIGAVLGIPNSVLGSPAANYATAKQQAQQYWSNQQKRGRRLAALFTKIAKRYNPNWHCEFDYAHVPELQDLRDRQLDRVMKHIANGVPAAVAYSFEGMPEIEFVSDVPEPAPKEEPAEEKALHLIKKKITDFPKKGDDKKVTMQNSQYSLFPIPLALKVKNKFPAIWSAGGNVLGHSQFEILKIIEWDHKGNPQNQNQEQAIKRREAWIARHKDNYLLAGVVAQMKWLAIGSRGLDHMRSVLMTAMEKEDQKNSRPKAKFLKQLENLAAYNAAGDTPMVQTRWQSWIEKAQGPTEDRLLRASYRYLAGAADRYSKRFKKQANQKAMITDWRAIFESEEETKRLLKTIEDIWLKGWFLSGETMFEEIFRLAKIDIPDGVIFGTRELGIQYIEESVAEMIKTSNKEVQKTIENGLLNGLGVIDIARNLETNHRFDRASAKRIARTESTRSLNLGASQAFKSAAAEGVSVKKKWLTAELPNVREAHKLLGEMDPIPVYDEWEIDGETAESPGSFGSAALDCNCRCTIIPIVD